jgi:hypothetical protein
MSGRMFILLLPLLALLMTWATRRFRFAPLPTVVLATLTAAAAWGILLLSTRLPSGSGEAEAFDSARYMVREVPREWLTRDLAERYGWLCGLVLYLLCWVTAKAWPGSRHA